MGIASLVFGIVSTLWSMIGGGWVSAAIGVIGAVLGMVAIKQKKWGAAAGLFLSVNGIAWYMIYITFVLCLGPVGELMGLK